MADAVGSSLRTVQRWSSERSHPTVDNLRKLAIVVSPHDAGIAKKLAALIGETAQSLGLATAGAPRLAEKTPNAAPGLPPKVIAALAESVVAAAAEPCGEPSAFVARELVAPFWASIGNRTF